MLSPRGLEALGQPCRGEDLAWRQLGQRSRQRPGLERLGDKGPGRDVDPGETQLAAGLGHGHEPVAAACVEQALLGQRPRGDDSDHVPSDQRLARPPAGLGRVLELLADRDAKALADQPVQVDLGAVDRHAAHRDVVTRMAAALGERNVQGRRCGERVLEEQLVEVAHPEEQQRVGMLTLQSPA